MARIAVDVDGTLAASLEKLMDYLNQDFGEELEKYGFSDFSVQDIEGYYEWGEKFSSFGITEDECIDILLNLWEDEYEDFDTIEPVEYVKENLKELNERYGADIVTANHHSEPIQAWLEYNGIKQGEHFGHFISTSRDFDEDIEKSELGYEYFIDDRAPLADSLRDGQLLLLYSRPYNLRNGEDEHPKIRRVDSLYHASNIIERSENGAEI